MARAERNEGRLVLVEEKLLLAARNLRSPGNHDPMLRAMMMHLQTELRARIDDDALDLETLAGIDALIGSPGAIDAAVLDVMIASLPLELVDDLLYILGGVAVRYQHR